MRWNPSVLISFLTEGVKALIKVDDVLIEKFVSDLFNLLVIYGLINLVDIFIKHSDL